MKNQFLNSLEKGLKEAKKRKDSASVELYQLTIKAFKEGYKLTNKNINE